MISRLLRSLVIALLGLGVVAACATAAPPTPGSATASSGSPAASSATAHQGATAERRAGTRVTKLLVFVVENHSMEQMQQDMPWVARLARRYGYTTGYHGVTHPSLPNYLAIAGGDTFGVTDDADPSAHPIRRPTVFGRAVRAGRTATTYAEGMTSRCQTTSAGRYAVKHNPWTYFTKERGMCRRNDVPLRRLSRDVDAGTLPNVGLAIPDMCHDGHDCPLSVTNRWMRRHVGDVLDGPDFASGHLAVVITADEDDNSHGNRVLTVVANPQISHQVVSRRMTHYALSRSYADVAGVAPLRHARTARSLVRAFGLRTP